MNKIMLSKSKVWAELEIKISKKLKISTDTQLCAFSDLYLIVYEGCEIILSF